MKTTIEEMDWKNITEELERDRPHRLYSLYGDNSPGATDLRNLSIAIKKSRYAQENSNDVILLPSRAQYINRHQYEGLFFQQRYQASYKDQGETVRQRLEKAGKNTEVTEFNRWIVEFELEELWNKPLLQLSSGEWQRFSVCEALLSKPGILIIPELLKGLDHQWQQKILLLISQKTGPHEIVMFTTDLQVHHPNVHNILINSDSGQTGLTTPQELSKELVSEFLQYQSTFLPDSPAEVLLRMSGVNIQYGKRKILQDIQWTVHAGDKWNIQGPNGAGKSTIISLVNSDNPQGYSQPIELFGSKYGSHSIWNRKARISYFGSDFFQYFRSEKPIEQSLFQQLKTPYLDTIQPPKALVAEMMSWFGLEAHRHLPYSAASRDIKRQLLLLVAYLKSSDILVLDEPYQDLSLDRIRINNQFLETIQPLSTQTVIFVTHREDHKPRFLDKRLVLDKADFLNDKDR